MKSIAIIPARGGSKRIARKNVKLLAGRPAIAYPIHLALNSGIFDRVIVSTDDAEIAQISRSFGAEVPFMRNAELSNDFTVTVEVIAAAAEELRNQGSLFDEICCLYPVTPLLNVNRLTEALEVLKAGDWDYVFPAIEFPSPIERGFKKSISGGTDLCYPEFANTRTQDLKKTFHDAGQFYFGKASAWLEKKPILNGNSTFIELEKNETLDVDDLEDWMLVEKLVEIQSKAIKFEVE
jgi:pseudaminic acid cytidylyltransferase